MTTTSVTVAGGRAYFTDDAVVYVDRWVHDVPA
jgi:hypothetical protein